MFIMAACLAPALAGAAAAAACLSLFVAGRLGMRLGHLVGEDGGHYNTGRPGGRRKVRCRPPAPRGPSSRPEPEHSNRVGGDAGCLSR
jgi:hypothetical protein